LPTAEKSSALAPERLGVPAGVRERGVDEGVASGVTNLTPVATASRRSEGVIEPATSFADTFSEDVYAR
jgi:hypothetical protein